MGGHGGVEEVVHKRKLIEVALPLEAINRESAREKSIRHGHPSTLHLWWSRKPLATTRAVLFAQLVDDPSSDPERFPTEELQRAERERLHALIEQLVVWENMMDNRLFEAAHWEIVSSMGGEVPAVVDPFAGGGSLPLEAQRFGLEAHASDLNPVAVLINKALIEIPASFRGDPPVFAGTAEAQLGSWDGLSGLVADVRAYGDWMRARAVERIGHLYPLASLADGSRVPVVAWVWARTVVCPNPACRVEVPLTSKWWLGQKPGREAFIVPSVVDDSSRSPGRRIEFSISNDRSGPSLGPTVEGRTGGVCLACEAAVPKAHIKAEAVAGRMGATLMATVGLGKRQRIYLPPTADQSEMAMVDRPDGVPDAVLATNSQYMGAPMYGMTTTSRLFTNRQLVLLQTLSSMLPEVRALVRQHGGSSQRAEAIGTYLAFAVSRLTSTNSSLCRWNPAPSKESVSDTFGRQALPIVWEFAEGNPFNPGPCDLASSVEWVSRSIERLVPRNAGVALQADAATRDYTGLVLNTDPPYYDYVPYADISDFFYPWLRHMLRDTFPDLLATISVPKEQELVANADRQGGKAAAKDFFESGFEAVFRSARSGARPDVPGVVYYAFKQGAGGSGGATGWETLLEAMIRAGWMITATWPMRSERSGRMRDVHSNALASSIVLAVRPRSDEAPVIDRRGFIAALEAELPEALRKLQQGRIAPVDLPQAAIGPGMAVYSRHARVIEDDGTRMPVRSALARINEVLDQVLNEQEGDFDSTSRFAIAWYRQHGYGMGKFGDADSLARARNTSVVVMDRGEILTSRAGNVQLVKPSDLPWDYDVLKDMHTSNWEALHNLIKVLERDGIAPAGDFLQAALSRPDGAVDPDLVKELAHLLFRIAEGNGWTKDALSFNNLVTSWPEILEVARSAKRPAAEQSAFDFDDGDD